MTIIIDDDTEELLRWKWSTGRYTTQELADEYKLPVEAVHKCLKLRGRPYKKFDMKRAMGMLRRGKSYREIADELGVAKSTAYRKLKQ